MQIVRTDTPISWGSGSDLLFVAVGILIAGTLAKLPMYVDFPISGYTVGDYYTRHIGFFILPVLIAFFCWKKSLSLGQTLVVVNAVLISFAYIN